MINGSSSTSCRKEAGCSRARECPNRSETIYVSVGRRAAGMGARHWRRFGSSATSVATRDWQNSFRRGASQKQRPRSCQACVRCNSSKATVEPSRSRLIRAGCSNSREKQPADRTGQRRSRQRVPVHEKRQTPRAEVLNNELIISEVSLDMTKWKTEKQFCSFLGLCPDNSISGGKVIHRATRKVYNRAADTLRLCAQSLTHSKSALGAKYRRLKVRLGAPKAIVAMAHHLALLVYCMLRYGRNYVEQGIHQYELKFQLQRIKWLKKRSQITQPSTRSRLATSTSSSWRDAIAQCSSQQPAHLS
jgi:Transposase IS116/IS110/IS902 family